MGSLVNTTNPSGPRLFWMLSLFGTAIGVSATSIPLKNDVDVTNRYEFSGSTSSSLSIAQEPPLAPTCPHRALSCPSISPPALDRCCLNHPSGHFILAQFWDTSPSLGPSDSWTLHGLWPDRCTGGYDAYCDDTRDLSAAAIETIVAEASSPYTSSSHIGRREEGLKEYMDKFWKGLHGDADLWSHEWNKHGTCVSTLELGCYLYEDVEAADLALSSSPSFPWPGPEQQEFSQRPLRQSQDNPLKVKHRDLIDYFIAATGLHASLDTFDVLASHGINPSTSRTYTLEAIQAALASMYPSLASSLKTSSSMHNIATIKCNSRRELNEIWLHYRVVGHMRNVTTESAREMFIPTAPDGLISTCPSSGIKYLPKQNGVSPPSPPHQTQTSVPHPAPTRIPSNEPFTGKGHLKIRVLADHSSTRDDSDNVDGDDATTTSELNLDLDVDIVTTNTDTKSLHRNQGCLIRQGAWYTSGTCATYQSQPDVGLVIDTIDTTTTTTDNNQNSSFSSSPPSPSSAHLFTLSSSYAPCAILESNTKHGGEGRFVCAQNLPVQSIFGAVDVTVRRNIEQGRSDDANMVNVTVLSWKDQTVFYADKIPDRFEKVDVFVSSHGGRGARRRRSDDGDFDGRNGERPVRLMIYWESV